MILLDSFLLINSLLLVVKSKNGLGVEIFNFSLLQVKLGYFENKKIKYLENRTQQKS